MKRNAFGLVAMVLAIGMVAATPVDAAEQKPLNGALELTFYAVPCSAEPDAPFLTWAGTAELNGVTYGWADFPTAPLVVDGKFVYFEEYWTIFTLAEGEDVTPAIACDPARVVLAGDNEGWGPAAPVGKADGTVTKVADPGPFDEVAVGSRMFWRGVVTDDALTQFKATLHIHPTR